MNIIAELAQEHAALYTYGPLGVICGWFMWRDSRIGTKLDTLSHRIDGMTRAMLVDVISRDTAGNHARNAAQEMLAKIQARDR